MKVLFLSRIMLLLCHCPGDYMSWLVFSTWFKKWSHAPFWILCLFVLPHLHGNTILAILLYVYSLREQIPFFCWQILGKNLKRIARWKTCHFGCSLSYRGLCEYSSIFNYLAVSQSQEITILHRGFNSNPRYLYQGWFEERETLKEKYPYNFFWRISNQS